MSNYKLVSILLFLTIITSLALIQAEEEQFGISLDCYEDCQAKDVDYSQDIIFVLSIKNNLDYWVSIGGEKEWSGADFRITVENINLENGKGGDLYNEVLGHKFFIKPRSQLKVYIPFNLYNELNEDNRLGDWTIYPELSVRDTIAYEEPFDASTGKQAYQSPYQIQGTIKGNALKFTSIKPEVKVNGKGPKLPAGLFEHPLVDKLLLPVIVIILGGVGLWYIKSRLS